MYSLKKNFNFYIDFIIYYKFKLQFIINLNYNLS